MHAFILGSMTTFRDFPYQYDRRLDDVQPLAADRSPALSGPLGSGWQPNRLWYGSRSALRTQNLADSLHDLHLLLLLAVFQPALGGKGSRGAASLASNAQLECGFSPRTTYRIDRELLSEVWILM